MAGVTSADLIMLFPRVTHAALRDDLVLANHGRMSFVAVQAGNGRLMFRPIALDSPDDRGMAFNAI